MSEIVPGDLVDGKYRIIRLIGEGGWGVVYEASNTRTLRRVALKLLRPRPELSADIRVRFEREAQAAGRIGSDHIVEVFDLGTLPDGGHYMVMELLHGQDLAKRLERHGPLDAVVAVKLLLQLLDGLAAAHDAGILHRDLKPENLFLIPARNGEDFVKILDFGVSKFNLPELGTGTLTGAILGSPIYMAPEQARGLRHLDARADLYSVGAVLFESLTGRVPFTGENFNDLMFKIALAPRPSPIALRSDLDPALAEIVTRSIAASPDDRFQTALEFQAALFGWLESRGILGASAPEYRSALNLTPRNSIEGRVSTPGGPSTPVPSVPSGSAGGTPRSSSQQVAATPLAGAASIDRKGAGSRGKAAVAIVVAAVGAAAALLVGLRVETRGERHAKDTSAPSAAPAVSLVPATVAEPPPPSEPPLPPVPEAPARLAPLSSVEASPVAASRRAASPVVHVAAVRETKGAGAADANAAPPSRATPSVVAETPPPPPPAAPPSSPPPPKKTDMVEGREFRTGL